jgi:protein-tyrosine phosphatase
MSYSINWKQEDLDGKSDMTLVLADQYGWKSEVFVGAGSTYVNITNLVPNDQYTYKVTADASGKVITEGNFSTTGHLHQVFFKSGCRNGRDLGGWKTLDGKMVKYRKLYRGGRMQSETVNASGKREILAEGIGAQLDLRGSDRIKTPAVEGLEFLAPGIEQGGTTMLKTDHAKTKQCFEFVVNCLRANKPVYFHCSLGRDRTGTLDILLLGLLGVREGDISKAYEVTYFAPVGYSVSSSEKSGNPKPIFKNTRMEWVYSDVVPYFWSLATDGTFASGVENYLLTVAQVSQKDIDDFRSMMLE